jgi:hypothetical protein
LLRFYEDRYPDVRNRFPKELDAAIAELIAIHERNVFPKMKVGFATYPSNIGHRNWPGCFRCHDNRHVSPSGKVLSMDCGLCHTKPQRGPRTLLGVLPAAEKNSDNWHPYALTGEHAKLLCHKCHAAGTNPARTCNGCHDVKSEGKMMVRVGCAECHLQTSAPGHPNCSEGSCHPTVSGLHKQKGHAVDCVRCHTPHTWKPKEPRCRSCHGGKQVAAGVWK